MKELTWVAVMVLGTLPKTASERDTVHIDSGNW